MTARRASNGDFVMSKSFLAILGLVTMLVGILVGAGVAWGTICRDVSDLKASQSDYVRQDAYQATLKSIDGSLKGIDQRLSRLEAAQDKKGR